jgi:DNA-binding IclR family transcriptional regulator
VPQPESPEPSAEPSPGPSAGPSAEPSAGPSAGPSAEAVTGPAPGDPEFRPVKSAYRALDVLEALAFRPATLSELSRLLDIPKSSLHGLVRTLTERGWIAPADGSTRFRLGLRALQVGARFVEEDEAVARVAPTLDRLVASTGETVQHGRLDGDQVVYLAKRDTAHQVRIISDVGARLPAHATALGKALLAARDDDTVARLLRQPLASLTSRTKTDLDALMGDLERARGRGYAVDDGEAADGLRCFAVVVPPRRTGDRALPTDAVSVSVPAFRLDADREGRLVAALLEAQLRLGGGLPAPFRG